MSESVSSNGSPAKGTRKRKTPAKAASVAAKAEAAAAKTAVPAVTKPEAVPQPTVVGTLRLGALDRRVMIETAAYYRAERRRFEAGHELEDWLGAEAEIEALLRARLEGAGRDAGAA